jgi:hypothetical protein
MVYFIPNILSKEECEFLSKQFDIEKIINFSSDKKENTNESYGFRPSYNFDKYMETLKSKVLGFNNEITHIDSVNTYVREYHNSAFLTKHIDRTDISVTMSICLESTINKEWPLFVEIDGKEYNMMNTLREKAFEVGCELLSMEETNKFGSELANLSCV